MGQEFNADNSGFSFTNTFNDMVSTVSNGIENVLDSDFAGNLQEAVNDAQQDFMDSDINKTLVSARDSAFQGLRDFHKAETSITSYVSETLVNVRDGFNNAAEKVSMPSSEAIKKFAYENNGIAAQLATKTGNEIDRQLGQEQATTVSFSTGMDGP